MSRNAVWRRSLGEMRWAPPFHPVPIPILQIPGMCQETILSDSCHCFHLGWGIDLVASGLVLVLKRRCFQAGTFDKKLELAYKNFTKWAKQKTTGIGWWSLKKLDMKMYLVRKSWKNICLHGVLKFVPLIPFETTASLTNQQTPCDVFRQNDWPTSLGSCNSKAYDTALVLEWMEDFLGHIEPWWKNITCISLSYMYRWARVVDRSKFFNCSDMYINCFWVFFLRILYLQLQDCSRDDLLQGLKYAVATSNLFFRTLRKNGVFIWEPAKSTCTSLDKRCVFLVPSKSHKLKAIYNYGAGKKMVKHCMPICGWFGYSFFCPCIVWLKKDKWSNSGGFIRVHVHVEVSRVSAYIYI